MKLSKNREILCDSQSWHQDVRFSIINMEHKLKSVTMSLKTYRRITSKHDQKKTNSKSRLLNKTNPNNTNDLQAGSYIV